MSELSTIGGGDFYKIPTDSRYLLTQWNDEDPRRRLLPIMGVELSIVVFSDGDHITTWRGNVLEERWAWQRWLALKLRPFWPMPKAVAHYLETGTPALRIQIHRQIRAWIEQPGDRDHREHRAAIAAFLATENTAPVGGSARELLDIVIKLRGDSQKRLLEEAVFDLEQRIWKRVLGPEMFDAVQNNDADTESFLCDYLIEVVEPQYRRDKARRRDTP